MIPVLTPPEQRWHCPSCGLLDVTRQVGPHTQMHPCPALAGLTVPMVPAGQRGVHRRQERQDYVGDEQVQLDADGRPVMSVQTIHDDGREDCTVYAPLAVAHINVS